jgi:hypothetical protein
VAQPAADLDRVELDLELAPHEARCLVLGAHLGRRRLLGTTSELLPGAKPGRWHLHGAPGTAGALLFAESAVVTLNGRRTHSKRVPAGGHAVTYTHPALLG